MSDLFGFGKRDFLESLNPLSSMKLRKFVIADDSSEHLRHYFRFKNREAQDKEFIVIYLRVDDYMLRYARTHWRRPGQVKDFITLNDSSPWWPAIARLIDMGQDLSSKTRARGPIYHCKYRPKFCATPFGFLQSRQQAPSQSVQHRHPRNQQRPRHLPPRRASGR